MGIPPTPHTFTPPHCYYTFPLRSRSFVRSVCMSLSLLFFIPQPNRTQPTVQDVCIIEEIRSDAVLVRPIDRCHPYPYLYPTYTKYKEWVSLCSNRIEPYLSRVKRPKPNEAAEYDLVDARDARTGLWHVAEVCANIGSAVWLLYIDNYSSAEHKDSRREWIDASSKRLGVYRDANHTPQPKRRSTNLSIGQIIIFDPSSVEPPLPLSPTPTPDPQNERAANSARSDQPLLPRARSVPVQQPQPSYVSAGGGGGGGGSGRPESLRIYDRFGYSVVGDLREQYTGSNPMLRRPHLSRTLHISQL